MTVAAFNSSWPIARTWRMSRIEYDRMVAWCEEHKDDPKVIDWLSRNPVPLRPYCSRWRGTHIEWAYLEMPQSPGFR